MTACYFCGRPLPPAIPGRGRPRSKHTSAESRACYLLQRRMFNAVYREKNRDKVNERCRAWRARNGITKKNHKLTFADNPPSKPHPWKKRIITQWLKPAPKQGTLAGWDASVDWSGRGR